MDLPPTLLDLAGRTIPLPDPGAATLVLIDLQNEYLAGPLRLDGAEAAAAAAARLLAAVRARRGRVVHVAHAGRAGGLFDRMAERGAFVDAATPITGEAVVEKRAISAFHGTNLAAHLPEPGTATLIVAGFMTHNCVSSTVRVAGDLGHTLVVAHDACATRSLPAPGGGVIDAATQHRAAIAGITDRFARAASVAEILGE
ncbi:MAG: isochorismatase family protein [Siculibacillus sp.]|nr:isochorismatase family protein [Siculibacillus sp.]